MKRYNITFLTIFCFIFFTTNANAAIVPLAGSSIGNDEHVILSPTSGDLLSIGDLSTRQSPCQVGQWSNTNCIAPKKLEGPTSSPICFDRCVCPSTFVTLGPNEVGVGASCDGKYEEFKCADDYTLNLTSGYCEKLSQCDAQSFPETRAEVFNSSDWNCTAPNSEETCMDETNTKRASCKCNVSHCSVYTSTYPLTVCPFGAICGEVTCTTNSCCTSGNNSSNCTDISLNKTKKFVVQDCMAGLYKDGSICEECPAGSSCVNGIAEKCPTGTYQIMSGQSYCEACPESAVVNPGETPHAPEVLAQCNL